MAFLDFEFLTTWSGNPSILLYGLLLSVVMGILPIGKFPLLWELYKSLGHFFYQKLNRHHRSATEKKVRGVIAFIIIGCAVVFSFRFLMSISLFNDYRSIIDIILIGLSLSTLQSWVTFIKGIKILKNNKANKTLFFNDLVQDDAKPSDNHKCHRDLVVYLSHSLNRFLIAPILFYLIFGVYGLIISSLISALNFSSHYKHQNAKDYAYVINMVYTVTNFVPAILTITLLSLVSLLVNPKSLRKIMTLFKQSKTWDLKIITAMANATELTLMGPALQQGYSTNQPWIGNEGATAKPKAEHLRKALLAYSGVLLITITATVILTFGFISVL